MSKPVIFLAFANDRDDRARYLRNLPTELREVRDALSKASESLCEVVVRTNATAGDIVDVFQDPSLRGRIAIFHYGGHAGSYELLLESASGAPQIADAGSLAAFFGEQLGLQLVFLNACSTQGHARGLLDSNVSAVSTLR